MSAMVAMRTARNATIASVFFRPAISAALVETTCSSTRWLERDPRGSLLMCDVRPEEVRARSRDARGLCRRMGDAHHVDQRQGTVRRRIRHGRGAQDGIPAGRSFGSRAGSGLRL